MPTGKTQAQIADRWRLAGLGALGGAALWAVLNLRDHGDLAAQPALVLVGFLITLIGVTMAMAGPVGLRRTLPAALGLALGHAALLWLVLQRHEEADHLFASPVPVFALILVTALPVPFLIARASVGWRDYAALFTEAWSIVVRYAAAWAFTGLVWLVVLLSDEMLQIVGLSLIDDLLAHEAVPFILTAGLLGLGMAVVHELADLLSPYLVLRMFRLLLPAVLAVMVVFVAALPFQGLDGLFSGVSPALLLLTMAGAGITLVSTAADQSDAEATQSMVIRRSAQGMSLILPILAGLAAWAIWQRVGQHGWTPDRLFVALVAALGVAYGVIYAVAVLRGAGWMGRIRQGNVAMALAVIVLAGLWLTPVLNAERISAQSQLARLEDGRVSAEDLDLAALRRWGKAGQDVLAQLAERAKAPGQEVLAARLAGEEPVRAEDARGDSLRRLVEGLPLQPASATGTRDTLLSGALDDMLRDWADVCSRGDPGGAPTCLMVVADLMPLLPGEEAILILDRAEGYVELTGLYLMPDGNLATRPVLQVDGSYADPAALRALMERWSETPPPLTPAQLNQLDTGSAGLLIQP